MAHVDLILTLTGGLAAALVCGYVTFRLGLSPIVGYLLAGFAVGPNTPGFTADQHLAEQLAEIGVILLMFGVGLQFHLKELLAVRRVAVPGALVRSLLVTLLGTILGLAYGWSWSAGLVFGLALSVASTVVLMRVLADHGDLHTPAGHVAVGWLVVEDLFTVLVLVLLPAIFGRGDAGIIGLLGSLGVSVVKVAAMIGLTFLVGERLIPWLLGRVAATRSRELFTLTVLVVALGIAVGSAKLFDVSMALGAFLAGMVVGRSEFSLRAATEALPMRDAFAVLFFVSVGILLHPTAIVESPVLVAATVAIILLGKPLITLIAMVRLKQHVRVAVPVALSTAQIGEFSFILASAGKGLGLLDDQATDAIIEAAILSITLNPLLYRLNGPLVRVLQRMIASPPPPRVGADAARSDSASDPDRFRAVVVGYGPVGRTSTRLLLENHVEPVVIEMNIDTVRQLASQGIRAIYGDATRRETLEKAGLANAAGLILSSAYMHGSAETIRHARELNPKVLIFARSTYLKENAALHRAGADVVFSSEGEVALAVTESLLLHLGATPEQLDIERARIRSELFEESEERVGAADDRLWPVSGNGKHGFQGVLADPPGGASQEHKGMG